MVFFTLISLINKQFIHLNANCMNSTPSLPKCSYSGRSIRDTSSAMRFTERWMPGCEAM